MNKLIQEAEQALEVSSRQFTQGGQIRPPSGSLIPPAYSTETLSSGRSTQERGQEVNRSFNIVPTAGPGKSGEQGEMFVPKSPLSPDKKSQREERNSVIDAIKQITGASRDAPTQEGMSIRGTPEYDWDTRFDGIQGFPSRLKNRVS